TTLRRAIAGLIQEGVLFHRHGAGTFVRRRPPHVEQALSRLTSFTEDMRSRGFVASSREIERGVFLPTPEEAMMLGVSPRDSVFRLVRQRLADGVPLAMERAAVPARFFGDPSRVGDSLYAALDAEGWLPVRALQRLRAVVLGAADAAVACQPAARAEPAAAASAATGSALAASWRATAAPAPTISA